MKPRPKITEEQRQALTEQSERPVYVVDVNSQDQYVLLRAQDYERYRSLFESDQFDISETYAAQQEALKQVWDDPTLDAYSQQDSD